jgi:HAD superfamily hydrolase (TIGR01509 family)
VTALYTWDPDVAAVISTAVFTTEIGVTKASVRAFHAACPALDAQPSRVLFVDDNPANVHGARDAGLTAIGFTNPQQMRPHLHAIGLT